MKTSRVSIRCITDKLASHSKIVVCCLSALCGKKSWRRNTVTCRSLRKCATLTATCQSAGRSQQAFFPSGIFCISQPSGFIKLLEFLQAAGKMSSLGCFLSRRERIAFSWMLPEVSSLSGGNKKAISFQAAPHLSVATPVAPPRNVTSQGWLLHRELPHQSLEWCAGKAVALPCHMVLSLPQDGI